MPGHRGGNGVPQSRHHDRIRCPEADDAEADSDHPMHHPFHVLGAGRLLLPSRDGTVEPNPVGRTQSSCAGVKTTVGDGDRITELIHRLHSQHWTGRSQRKSRRFSRREKPTLTANLVHDATSFREHCPTQTRLETT